MSDTDSEQDNDDVQPVLLVEANYGRPAQNTLPAKSRRKYENTYDVFIKWKISKKAVTSEDWLLVYFQEFISKYKPTTVWAQYSMLKSMIKIKENIDISTFHILLAALKNHASGYESKKSKVFTEKELKKFLCEAPDETYLANKTIIIFGIMGCCHGDEITYMKVQDVKQEGSIIVVNIPQTRTNKPRQFIIDAAFSKIVKKYQKLRPKNCRTDRFFLTYHKLKCTNQPIGKNKIANVPKEIATWLNLPDPNVYTGRALRRCSATLLSNAGDTMTDLEQFGGWQSNKVAQENVEDFLENKNGISNLVETFIHNEPSTTSETEKPNQYSLSPCIQNINIGYNEINIKQEYIETDEINIKEEYIETNEISSLPPLKKAKVCPLEEPNSTNQSSVQKVISMNNCTSINFTYRGVIVPVFTPFHHDEKRSLNLAIIPEYAKFLASKNVPGILVNGTTGEGPSLSLEERKKAAEVWAAAVKNTKQHLMIQVGGAALTDVKELAAHAEKLGVDSLLCLPELYFKAKTEDQLIEYLKEVAQAAPRTPLLYYHIPSFSMVDIHMGRFLKKIGNQIPTFAGIKFTSGNLEEGYDALVANDRFAIFLGSDKLVAAGSTIGMDSFIITSLNFIPEPALDILEFGKGHRDLKSAQKSQKFISSVVNEVASYGAWVETMKIAMSMTTNLFMGPPRNPNKLLTKKQVQDMEKSLNQIGLKTNTTEIMKMYM